jgi:hypothetical protein
VDFLIDCFLRAVRGALGSAIHSLASPFHRAFAITRSKCPRQQNTRDCRRYKLFYHFHELSSLLISHRVQLHTLLDRVAAVFMPPTFWEKRRAPLLKKALASRTRDTPVKRGCE